jgi:putative FmdB family regulatory protein
MPIYEYKCAAGHTFTRIVSFSEFAETVACEKCSKKGKPRLAKLQMSLTGQPKFKAGGAGGFYKPNA